MSSNSPSTTSTTSPTVKTDDNNEDDIWGSDDGNTTHDELLSDLPAIRRKHIADGYREGLSIGKARVMQSGFDEGYPIGVALAMRVGPILGVLEAYLACKSINTVPELHNKVKAVHAEAVKALDINVLVSKYDEHPPSDSPTTKTTAVQESNEEIISYWEKVATAVYETRMRTLANLEKEKSSP